MNKDVVYIEPEDDITDIIEKVKQAEKKVVALVPPKKIGIMRSAVNTKLLAKAAKTSEKIAVVITTDASLIKLSAAAGLPVAKSLQSRPKLPEEINTDDLSETNEPIAIDGRDFNGSEKKSEDVKEKSIKNQPTQGKQPKNIDEEINSVELEEEAKKKDKGEKKAKKKIPDMDKTRKWIIIGVSAGILMIVFLVWAIVFAPAAKITVAMRTTDNNFTEDVSFVTSEAKASVDSGVFYLENTSQEKGASVDFAATGERDEGTKASGTLTLTATFGKADLQDYIGGGTPTISVPAGSSFVYNNLSYTNDSAVTFKLDDEEIDNCPSYSLGQSSWSCTITATRLATAAENGDKYNIGQTGMNFTTSISGITATNSTAFAGGTSKAVKYVQESDVNAAKVKLTQQELETVTIDDLKKEFGDDYLVIESSFAKEEGEVEVLPKVGEMVSDGTTPKISIKTKYSVSAVKKDGLIAFITKKTEEELADDQRMYDAGTPFIERFTNNSGTFSGKLKTTTKSGPRVDEKDIMEKSKGKSKEEVRSLLKSINGVSSVNVQTSYFWVGTVPDDESKVTIELEVEE
ncbi:MAG: hypothetical protein Q4F60_00185 [Candidatus Saccharibacteria bacterium]|nr:hypothetical protein [Candidatus Saccharibacteria bacterium]